MQWKEERNILAHEMEWTLRYMHFHYQKWNKASEGVQDKEPGHKAYALKQMAMWKRFGENAQAEFSEAREDMPDCWNMLVTGK